MPWDRVARIHSTGASSQDRVIAIDRRDAESIPVTVPRTIEEPAYRTFLGALSGAATAHGIPGAAAR